MLSKKTATILVTMLTIFSSHGNAQAQSSRLETVVAFARSQDTESKKKILAQPELRQELGITDPAGVGAEFKYDLAFQETFINDDVTTGMFEMNELIGQSSAVVIPFCKSRTCILATYDEDEETGSLSLVSYGSSVRSSRIAASYARLAKVRPGYKGVAQVVDYPAGMASFLMIDGKRPNGEVTKEFLHATDEQAARFAEKKSAIEQIVTLNDLADLIVKVDTVARQNAVQLGPLEETKEEGKLTMKTSILNKPDPKLVTLDDSVGLLTNQISTDAIPTKDHRKNVSKAPEGNYTVPANTYLFTTLTLILSAAVFLVIRNQRKRSL